MEKSLSTFDDIVFEHRNKEFGAYVLRKNYPKVVLVSTVIAVTFFVIVAVIPFIQAAVNPSGTILTNDVQVELTDVDMNKEDIITPPPPPPPDVPSLRDVVRFVAPVVVDSVDEDVELDVVDQLVQNAPTDSVNQDGPDLVDEPEDPVINYTAPEIILIAEEMPRYVGGDEVMFAFIRDNVQYPRIPLELGIEGKVLVQFVVMSDGKIDRIKIVRGIDPALDEEAARVVSTMPVWEPGRQGGHPVNVQFVIPISFKIRK